MMLHPLLSTRKATSARTRHIRLLEVELKRQPLELYEEQMRKPPTGDNGSEFTAPLLSSESPRKMRKFYKSCQREIKSNGPIEDTFTRDVVMLIAERERLRASKEATLTMARPRALLRILKELGDAYGTLVPELSNPPELLACQYFKDSKVQQEVHDIFARFGFDASVIEAQAVKDEMPFLEAIEKLLASVGTRLENALALLAAYRETFPHREDQSTTPALNGKEPSPRQINKATPTAEEEE
jgi:hypothetical protein